MSNGSQDFPVRPKTSYGQLKRRRNNNRGRGDPRNSNNFSSQHFSPERDVDFLQQSRYRNPSVPSTESCLSDIAGPTKSGRPKLQQCSLSTRMIDPVSRGPRSKEDPFPIQNLVKRVNGPMVPKLKKMDLVTQQPQQPEQQQQQQHKKFVHSDSHHHQNKTTLKEIPVLRLNEDDYDETSDNNSSNNNNNNNRAQIHKKTPIQLPLAARKFANSVLPAPLPSPQALSTPWQTRDELPSEPTGSTTSNIMETTEEPIPKRRRVQNGGDTSCSSSTSSGPEHHQHSALVYNGRNVLLRAPNAPAKKFPSHGQSIPEDEEVIDLVDDDDDDEEDKDQSSAPRVQDFHRDAGAAVLETPMESFAAKMDTSAADAHASPNCLAAEAAWSVMPTSSDSADMTSGRPSSSSSASFTITSTASATCGTHDCSQVSSATVADGSESKSLENNSPSDSVHQQHPQRRRQRRLAPTILTREASQDADTSLLVLSTSGDDHTGQKAAQDTKGMSIHDDCAAAASPSHPFTARPPTPPRTNNCSTFEKDDPPPTATHTEKLEQPDGECIIVDRPQNESHSGNGTNDRSLRSRESGEETKRIVDQCSDEVFHPTLTWNRDYGDKRESFPLDRGNEIAGRETSSSRRRENTAAAIASSAFSLAKQNDPGQKLPLQRDDGIVTTTNVNTGLLRGLAVVANNTARFVANTAKNFLAPKTKSKFAKRTPIRAGESLKGPDSKRQEESETSPRRTTRSISRIVKPISLKPDNPPERRRKRSFSKAEATPKRKPEIVEIFDVEEYSAADEVEESMLRKTYDVVRISIGQIVVHLDCKVVFHTHGDLTLEFRHRMRQTQRTPAEDFYFDIDLVAHVEELSFFRCGEPSRNDTDDFEDFSFLALRTRGALTKKMQKINKNYDPTSNSPELAFVVVEFREDADIDALLTDIELGGRLEGSESGPKEVARGMEREYCTVLLKHSEQEANTRRSSFHSKTGNGSPLGRSAFPADEDAILVVYPFDGDNEAIEKAAAKLNELKDGRKAAQDQTDEERQKATFRNHFLTIQVKDALRLEPEQYMNDTLIDFWMKWISRADTSNTHFFTTHFYTALSSKGVSGVKNWTERKGINIFTKKFIFFPINKTLHWSLAVAVNSAHIQNQMDEKSSSDAKALSCILFFDSLKAHSKAHVANKIREWLNAEWQRINSVKEQPFTSTSMVVYAPKIPYQQNGWDCGVYVCRYAYGLYNLRKEVFSANQCEVGPGKSQPFRKMITESSFFLFDASDIDRIRSELSTLIHNLSKVYNIWKKEVDRLEKEEARRLKNATGSAVAGKEQAEAISTENASLQIGHQKDDQTSKEACAIERHASLGECRTNPNASEAASPEPRRDFAGGATGVVTSNCTDSAPLDMQMKNQVRSSCCTPVESHFDIGGRTDDTNPMTARGNGATAINATAAGADPTPRDEELKTSSIKESPELTAPKIVSDIEIAESRNRRMKSERKTDEERLDPPEGTVATSHLRSQLEPCITTAEDDVPTVESLAETFSSMYHRETFDC